MSQPVPRDVLLKVRKLALLPEEVKQSQWAVSITRLTTLKSLCHDPDVANRFVTYLARKALERVEAGRGRSHQSDEAKGELHRQMMGEALAGMAAWFRDPSDERRQALRGLLNRMEAEQNEHEKVKWDAVRLITDEDLLLVEYTLRCVLGPAREAPYWAYQTARHYAERYTSSEGTGLTSPSVPLVRDIADFWIEEFALDPAALTAPAVPKKAKGTSPSTGAHKGSAGKRKKAQFTHRQGQFLAFIHLYRKLHRRGPAELDTVKYFRVTPPSVHGMVVKLEELGLITREPGVPRSARVAIPKEEIPPLDDVAGHPL